MAAANVSQPTRRLSRPSRKRREQLAHILDEHLASIAAYAEAKMAYEVASE